MYKYIYIIYIYIYIHFKNNIFPFPFKLNGIYDRGGNFPSDFETNGGLFGSKSKESCNHDHIPRNP